jgi:hypothetical protein
MSNTGSEAPRPGTPPGRGRRLVIGGVIALLLAGAVGLGLYWYDWKSARTNWPAQTHDAYLKVQGAFMGDIEAGRLDSAYQSMTDSFRKRVSREAFGERAGRYRAFKQRAGVAAVEARSNGGATAFTLRDGDGNQLEVSVTVVQEEDSFLYRRPPPLRVGEFTVGEVTPKAPGNP